MGQWISNECRLNCWKLELFRLPMPKHILFATWKISLIMKYLAKYWRYWRHFLGKLTFMITIYARRKRMSLNLATIQRDWWVLKIDLKVYKNAKSHACFQIKKRLPNLAIFGEILVTLMILNKTINFQEYQWTCFSKVHFQDHQYQNTYLISNKKMANCS